MIRNRSASTDSPSETLSSSVDIVDSQADSPTDSLVDSPADSPTDSRVDSDVSALLVARCASRPEQSRGRLIAEEHRRGWRDAFQRDRDRIIHSSAFRRLRHKTQVFISPEGDHYRVRLTHSMEVAQIGRVIARSLGLNEDLTEAICLAHDIGHPPFGHAGEDALQAAMSEVGGFDHNGHALRILMKLERAYPTFEGLNLSWETLEGLAKHNGPIAEAGWALAEADALFVLDLWSFASLEAQVAAVADDIAYDNHDIDDGLRAGILSVDKLLAEPFVAATYRRTEALYPSANREQILRETIREQIGSMVGDVVAESKRRIIAAGVDSVDEVRGAKTTLVAFSPSMQSEERRLKKFMYANLYRAPEQLEAAKAAQEVVAGLFAAYSTGAPPFDHVAPLSQAQKHKNTRAIGDYIAGMSDVFALDRYAELCGKVPKILRRT